MKKKQTLVIDEKFIRKFGMENKSQIVNDALAKYFFDEKQGYKNDLQFIKDLHGAVEKLNEKVDNLLVKIASIETRLDLNFNMSLFGVYAGESLLQQAGQQPQSKEKLDEERKKIEELSETTKSKYADLKKIMG
ncbi:MAG: hypothetical protein M1276_04010 [Deltaproteobacteria bacterium]|jgi:hypothetical protein|nr:hypothetical protein [Deltaproteobacteria bacterium]